MSRPEGQKFIAKLGRDELIFETGRLAQQAGGSVVVRSGDSVLLVTATASKSRREAVDFLPLTIEFEEKLYAAGRIPGNFFRREGRPMEDAVLACRLTDRPLRPLFDKTIRNEIQVVITALSSDGAYHLDIMGVNGASAALMISDIPWGGPVGAIRVGLIEGELVLNPNVAQMETSTLDLRIAGTKEAILMVEAGADEVSEALLLEALQLAHEGIQRMKHGDIPKRLNEIRTGNIFSDILLDVTQGGADFIVLTEQFATQEKNSKGELKYIKTAEKLADLVAELLSYRFGLPYAGPKSDFYIPAKSILGKKKASRK